VPRRLEAIITEDGEDCTTRSDGSDLPFLSLYASGRLEVDPWAGAAR